MMGSQKRDLLEQNMVFFGQQMYSLPIGFPGFAFSCRVLSAKLLQINRIHSGFFDDSEVLALLNLKRADKFFVLRDKFFLNLGLLRDCVLKHANILHQSLDVALIFLDKWPDSVTAQ